MCGCFDIGNQIVIFGGLRSYIVIICWFCCIIFIVCGIFYYSCMVVRGVFEEFIEIFIVVEFVFDFLDCQVLVFRDDICVFVFQFGEIVDLLMVFRYCFDCGVLIVGIVNVVGFSIFFFIYCGVYVNVGFEIGVVFIKVYIL